MQYDAVNLAQGFPDFPAPAEVKRAAQDAIAADVNQYAITWGAKSLRVAIARQMQEWQGIEVDPEKEIVVCCGSTEAMIATLLAVCNKGDEVVVFEPFYENYGPDAILSGAKPRFVSLRPPQASKGEGRRGGASGRSTNRNCAMLFSTRRRNIRPISLKPRRSSLTRQTTLPARCSAGKNWN